MKLSFYPLILLALVGFTACNKDSQFSMYSSSESVERGTFSVPEGEFFPSKKEIPKPEMPEIPVVENPRGEVPKPKEPTSEEPQPEYSSNFEAPACRYSFSMTTGGKDIKLTVISSPYGGLNLEDYKEYRELSESDKSFLSQSVNDAHSDISIVDSKRANQQRQSEKLKIVAASPKAEFNTIHSDLLMQYHFDGDNAKFSSTSIKKNAKLFLVMDSKESGDVSITRVEDGAEIFIVFLTSGFNSTCVDITGTKGQIASYVKSEDGDSAFSQMTATSFSKGSSVIQSIVADQDALGLIEATELGSGEFKSTSIAGGNSHLEIDITDSEDNAKLYISQVSGGESIVNLDGTSAGLNNLISLDMSAGVRAQASFAYTDHSNLEISGKMTSPENILILDRSLEKSKKAKINVIK